MFIEKYCTLKVIPATGGARKRSIPPALAGDGQLAMEQGRHFCSALMLLASEGRWTNDRRVLSLALDLISQQAKQAVSLLTALQASTK
jgi:hypothetical protein